MHLLIQLGIIVFDGYFLSGHSSHIFHPHVFFSNCKHFDCYFHSSRLYVRFSIVFLCGRALRILSSSLIQMRACMIVSRVSCVVVCFRWNAQVLSGHVVFSLVPAISIKFLCRNWVWREIRLEISLSKLRCGHQFHLISFSLHRCEPEWPMMIIMCHIRHMLRSSHTICTIVSSTVASYSTSHNLLQLEFDPTQCKTVKRTHLIVFISHELIWAALC